MDNAGEIGHLQEETAIIHERLKKMNIQLTSPAESSFSQKLKPIFKSNLITTKNKEEKRDLDQLNLNSLGNGEQEFKSAEIERRKNLFYNRFADTILEFSNGESLKVSSAFLIEKSVVFDSIFTRSQQIKVTQPFLVYKLFLDCLMEFQDISFDDALQIFPLALEANVEKLIEKCKNLLKPIELNENISLTLNMGVSIRHKELVKMLINFLLENGRIYILFSKERYYFPLSPESVRELLCHFEIDAFIRERILNWGKNYYLNVYKKTDDRKPLLLRHLIMEKVTMAEL